PGVRERSREDRLALVTRLLADLKPQLPGCPSECAADTLDRLLSAPWPGNVREMRNVIERAMLLARGAPALGPEHLPPDLRKAGGAGGGGGGGGGWGGGGGGMGLLTLSIGMGWSGCDK